MPVTIPPFTNVPAPGDPVASPWAQQLTQSTVDQYVAQAAQPTSAYAELWYDTDDAGSSFPNMPRGVVDVKIHPGTDTSVPGGTTQAIAGTGVTWTADPTRRYRTTIVACITAVSANAAGTVAIATATATVVVIGGGYSSVGIWPTAGYMTPVCLSCVESGLSGTQTRQLALNSAAGVSIGYVGSFSRNGITIVEDIGAANQSGGGVWTAPMPNGIMGQATGPLTDTAWGSSGWQDVSGASVTFTPRGTVGTNRWIRGVWQGTVKFSASNAVTLPGVHDGTAQYAIQEIAFSTAITASIPFNVSFVKSLPVGTAATWKGQLYANGAGVTLMGAGGRNSRLIIEDLGQA